MDIGGPASGRAVEAVSFLMSRTMLCGIKDRAEGLAVAARN
jgi:hypothetical protein